MGEESEGGGVPSGYGGSPTRLPSPPRDRRCEGTGAGYAATDSILLGGRHLGVS